MSNTKNKRLNIMNKIGFIGGGKMACAIIKGIKNSYTEILVSAKTEATLKKLSDNFQVKTTLSNIEVAKNSDVVILSVKPFILREVLEEIKSFLTKDKLVISIAAGISINTIEEIIGKIPVIRVMPNTPALVNAGMSAICAGNCALKEHINIAFDIFKTTGEVIQIEEKYIDIITAISGSGPAFYYYIINEIAKAGETLGLDYQTCLKLSAQTALGSAKMIMESGTTPEQLIVNVTTPGGCTAEGNKVLNESEISKILKETIEKTEQKAFELGKK